MTSPPVGGGVLRWDEATVRVVGDVGVMVDLPPGVDALVLRDALAGDASFAASELVPGWETLLVVDETVEPVRLADRVRAVLAAGPAPRAEERPGPARPVTVLEIPVVYQGEDLAAVARSTALSEDEVVARHCAPTYTVALLGFSRGFPYLRGLDPRLRVPRLASPRVRVPAGSVGIAGDQTGIYPVESPSGWRLLGRTDAVLFDAGVDPPSVLAAGTRVRFVPVPG
jgi:KipI family sensor histidine kinase inhibitor